MVVFVYVLQNEGQTDEVEIYVPAGVRRVDLHLPTASVKLSIAFSFSGS